MSAESMRRGAFEANLESLLSDRPKPRKGTQPVNTTVRTRWTPADEATLRDLLDRKERVMTANRAPLEKVASRWLTDRVLQVDTQDPQGMGTVKRMVDELIASADELRDALEPFDSGARAKE